ncbi:polysaccharide deacetylase family protein [Candidatus Pelagibacter sp. Uisw_099_02]|uniref:polysaccharide deacetylase family protein n=1 Tax=Candidatus Pelagibacter sp. Uisw_099_02 TaxID=3230981 RepID=UPI002369F67C|nr:polysaccharide deacetylase family protein [Candidatus Pelagibacter sp.]
MNVKKILSLAASTIKLFIIILLFNSNSKAEEKNIKYYYDDKGILSLMYHRFNDNKYPSTNIQMDVFKQQMQIIKNLKYNFYDPKDLEKNFHTAKIEKKILITIDDAFSSFYEFAWPYLKKEKIPFILFVSTESVGKNGYMTWNQIKELETESAVYIGNHSHTHDYLVGLKNQDFMSDIDTSSSIFKEKLGYNPIYFSYPFGEYSTIIKEYISKNFKFSFGQHSGVIDINKDRYELPRFPINEKYGDLKRFEFLINLYPLQYKVLHPDEKYLTNNNNPPKFLVEFFEEQKNIKNINCFSDEGNKWKKSIINFNQNTLKLNFRDKFNFRRGRINCSLNDDGVWRWFGVQFSVKQN